MNTHAKYLIYRLANLDQPSVKGCTAKVGDKTGGISLTISLNEVDKLYITIETSEVNADYKKQIDDLGFKIIVEALETVRGYETTSKLGLSK